MDDIFHKVRGLRGALDVVKVAREMPRRYGKHGELLVRYEDTEAYQDAERRRSSVASMGIKRGEKPPPNGAFGNTHADTLEDKEGQW